MLRHRATPLLFRMPPIASHEEKAAATGSEGGKGTHLRNKKKKKGGPLRTYCRIVVHAFADPPVLEVKAKNHPTDGEGRRGRLCATCRSQARTQITKAPTDTPDVIFSHGPCNSQLSGQIKFPCGEYGGPGLQENPGTLQRQTLDWEHGPPQRLRPRATS